MSEDDDFHDIFLPKCFLFFDDRKPLLLLCYARITHQIFSDCYIEVHLPELHLRLSKHPYQQLDH